MRKSVFGKSFTWMMVAVALTVSAVAGMLLASFAALEAAHAGTDTTIDYTIGDKRDVRLLNNSDTYFKFMLEEEAHVHASIEGEGRVGFLRMAVYSEGGDLVSDTENTLYSSNSLETQYYMNHSCNVKPGLYLLDVHNGNANERYVKVQITAEPLISLGRTSITSLASPSVGKLSTEVEAIDNALGYEFKISTSSDFSEATTVESATSSYKGAGLAEGAFHYVMARAYATYSDGQKVYGGWSTTKSVYVSKSTCTVSFDSAGGTEVASQEIEPGSVAEQPADPTREGYVFSKWLLDGKPFDFAAPVEEDIILKASWSKDRDAAADSEGESDESAKLDEGESGETVNSDEAANPGDSPAPADERFSDVAGTDWVAKEGWLDYAVGEQLMSGYAGTDLFGPYDNVTRGQVATILFRRDNPGDETTTVQEKFAANATAFTDNVSRQYYTAAINWAKKAGVMTGDAPNYVTVRPGDGITRQELATMLYRFAKAHGSSMTGASAASYSTAPDAAAVAGWASAGIGWCFHNGVMTGAADTGMLNPDSLATRAEMAKMITVVSRDVLG